MHEINILNSDYTNVFETLSNFMKRLTFG